MHEKLIRHKLSEQFIDAAEEFLNRQAIPGIAPYRCAGVPHTFSQSNCLFGNSAWTELSDEFLLQFSQSTIRLE
jgi:hypothetical protein